MQRVYAMSAGYEDVNDHDRLRNDSLLATICGKEDPEGNGVDYVFGIARNNRLLHRLRKERKR